MKQTNLVVVGAGIVGCSAAYHLAKLGWRDILVLDQGPLFETGGSTSHAPGLIFQTNGSRLMCKMAQYTVGLLGGLGYSEQLAVSSEQLAVTSDQSPVSSLQSPDSALTPCFYSVGSIEVATTPERAADLYRRQGWAAAYGLEGQVISPAEVKGMIPILDEQAILAGYHVPSDGDARGWFAAASLAQLAMSTGGVAFQGETKVLDVLVENGRVTGVMTDRGRVACEAVLLCTNIWGPVLGDKLGLPLPLYAVEHQYLISEPLPELAQDRDRFVTHPILRHQDKRMYFRQHGDAYGIGSYCHEPRLVSPYALQKSAIHPFTPDDFDEAREATDILLPALKGREYVTRFNGMFAFTIDGYPVLGESQTKGLWSAIGIWVTHSGGAGKTIAELMTHGTTEWDIREASIDRFHRHHTTPNYVALRCAQQYREVYDILHPLQQMENPRNLRLSPYHERLVAQKGVFFENSGWEVAQWYEANEGLLAEFGGRVPERTGWAAQNWSRIQGAEHLATRERVGLFNLTQFTKIEVSGPGALAFLNFMAANQVDQPVGKVVYTTLLNQAGGIKADLTITRTGETSFLVLTGAGGGPQDVAWLRQHAPTDGSVMIEDVTSRYAAVGLWGPLAREVLARVTPDEVRNEAFPYFTSRPLTIDSIPVSALRLSYAGELGWEIYAPMEMGLRLWDVLWDAGQPSGLVAVGAGAFNSLRLEKGYRAWGSDIHTEYNPFEAGLGWAVRLKKGNFLGREALLKAREQGIQRQLCCLTLTEPGAVLLGKEPILVGEQVLGYVTSSDFGYSVGQHIVYGYLPVEYAVPGTPVEIQYFGERVAAAVREEPLYDRQMERLRA
ncbi:MAG: FAD-dependent oxidoreductase [Chloroflexi bacterium]|nr:FAD-dependent oxidoreductase [Chloroflexota bacterium]